MVRFKNRYILIEVNPLYGKEGEIFALESSQLYFSIMNKVQEMHGDFGAAAVKSCIAKYCNELTRVAIIKARHGPHKFITSCLPCIHLIQRNSVAIRILYVGATMRQCWKFLLNYQTNQLEKVYSTLTTDEQKEAMKEAYLNCDWKF